MQALKIVNLSGELRAKNMKRKESDLSILQQPLKQLVELQNQKLWKKMRLCEWKPFVTFEMPVNTIYHLILSYEGT